MSDFKAEGYSKASNRIQFAAGQLWKNGLQIASLTDISVERKHKEIRSGYRGIVRAEFSTIEWSARVVSWDTDPGLNTELVTLICSRPNNFNEWNYARLNKCSVKHLSTQGDIVSVTGEAFPDESGNIAEFIYGPEIPAPAPDFNKTMPELAKNVGKSFEGLGSAISVAGEAFKKIVYPESVAPPPEKKKEEKKPFVPGVVVFTKRMVDFEDE